MKKLAILFMSAGLAVLSYPTLNHAYEDYKQNELIRQFEAEQSGTPQPDAELAGADDPAAGDSSSNFSDQGGAALEPGPAAVSDAPLPKPLQDSKATDSGTVPLSGKAGKSAAAAKAVSAKSGTKAALSSVYALLEINRIKLRLPVLEGASNAHLKVASAHMTGTGNPGETGNAVIAAHRSYSYGRMFNRLGELESGDTIDITFKGKTYTYTVYAKKTIKPTDLSILKPIGHDETLTLFTCDENGSHRIVVQAKLN